MTKEDSTPTLRDIQLAMRNAVRAGEHVDTHVNDHQWLSQHLETKSTDSPEKRLEIYRVGYFIRRNEALSVTYENIKKVLGQDAFSVLCYEYIVACGSKTYNLNAEGEDLPQFLKTHWLKEQYPYLPDLAQLEWLFQLTFDAPSYPALLPETAARYGDFLPLTLQPHVQLLKTNWPLLTLLNQETKETPHLTPLGRPCYILVHRDENHQPISREIEPNAFYLLKKSRSRSTLSEVCEAVLTDPEHLTHWFANWMQLGIFQNPSH